MTEGTAQPTRIARIDRIIEGLHILRKYDEDMRAEHDQIWAGGEGPVSPEDAKRLEELSWFEDPEGGWSIFV